MADQAFRALCLERNALRRWVAARTRAEALAAAPVVVGPPAPAEGVVIERVLEAVARGPLTADELWGAVANVPAGVRCAVIDRLRNAGLVRVVRQGTCGTSRYVAAAEGVGHG